MMKLVYKLQAEDYKYEIPVSYLPVGTPLFLSCHLFLFVIPFKLVGLYKMSRPVLW